MTIKKITLKGEKNNSDVRIKIPMKPSTKHLPCCFCGKQVDHNEDELCSTCNAVHNNV
ncbi:hypothetical protein LCGC14_0377670 [marine sediment metagenome]|uniref:Uncharacterized protein n=1 Tax=marine sediment metagenome TaxID=412755 RepID=A0A0F9T2Y4_9ZZZZ